MSEKYNYLLGESIEILKENETKVYEITEQLLDAAESKVINRKRSRYKDNESSDEFILQEYTTEEEIISAARSIAGLNKGYIKQREVKLEDVRDMDLSLSNWDTYKEQERKFAEERLNSYKEYYTLDAPNDLFGIYDVIDLEVRMQIIRLYMRVAKPKDYKDYDTQLKELRKEWSKTLEDLNLKKKQRDNLKKPKDERSTISDQLSELERDRPIEELQHEVDSEEEEERRMIESRKR